MSSGNYLQVSFPLLKLVVVSAVGHVSAHQFSTALRFWFDATATSVLDSSGWENHRHACKFSIRWNQSNILRRWVVGANWVTMFQIPSCPSPIQVRTVANGWALTLINHHCIEAATAACSCKHTAACWYISRSKNGGKLWWVILDDKPIFKCTQSFKRLGEWGCEPGSQ
jgi:hypothetical protein